MLKSAIRSMVPESLYDTLRRAKQRRLTSHFKSYVAEHSFGGYRLSMNIADPVAAEWYDHDEDQIPEIDFLKRFNLTGSTIFDLGAHQCMVAMLLAEIAGKSGNVIAVEANSHNHAIAERNLLANGYDNVACIKGIISSGNVAVSIDGGLNGRARHADSATPDLDILTIDEMSRRFGEPSLVFLDIEGHEVEALSGALRTLAIPTCHWFIELHGDADLSTYGHKNKDIFRFFPASMFRAYLLDPATGEFGELTRQNLPHERCHVFFERL